MLALLLCLCAPQAEVGEPAAPAAGLREALAAAVALPSPDERARAARELARRPGVPLATWQQLCAAFAPCSGEGANPLAPGPNRHRVDLPVAGGTDVRLEPTDLHLYVPRGYDPARPWPLLLWGHGAGGDGAREHLPWQPVAESLGMLVLAPSEAGGEAGWGFTGRERSAQLAALRWARQRANVDENRVYLGGASRGGHMTWDLALRHPDLWAALAPCIGGPRLQPGPQNNLRYLENVAHLPIRDLQGAADDPLLLANLRLCFRLLSGFGAADARLVEFADRGHSFDLGAVEWSRFLTARRDPVPQSVVRLSACAGEQRAAWVEILAVDREVAEEFPLRVDGRRWQQLDEQAKREYVHELVLARTARLRVARTGPGEFAAEGRGVKEFRLLLTGAMCGDGGAVLVRWNGRTIRRRAEPQALVLLQDFVERFDRTFLPVAAVTVP